MVVCESVPTRVSGKATPVAVVDDRGQELQVDLVDDARAGRHDAQVAEGGLGPAQQLVALAVALVLALHVEGEGGGRPEPVDLDRVIDDQVGRDQRIHARGVTPELGHRIAHDRQVDDGRHAGEVLEDDPRGHERDLGLSRLARPPGGEGLHVGRVDDAAAGMPKHVLEQDPDRDRQRGRARRATQGVQAIQVGQPRAERGAGAERVVMGSVR